MEASPARKGTIAKLFGAILIMLGVLDSLLTLRGGVPAYEFLMLVFAGAAVFAFGAIRGAGAAASARAELPVDGAAQQRSGVIR